MNKLNKLNSEELDKIIKKYKPELERNGISCMVGYKHRILYYNDKLAELAKKCNSYSIFRCLDSNWRELFDYQEKYFYDYIIRDYYKKEK